MVAEVPHTAAAAVAEHATVIVVVAGEDAVIFVAVWAVYEEARLPLS